MNFNQILKLARKYDGAADGILAVQKLAKEHHYKGTVGFDPYHTWCEWLKYWESLYVKRAEK